MRALRFASLALALSMWGCAGGPHPWSGKTVCEMDIDASSGAPDADAWIRLLLRGFDPDTRRATSPAVDCTGTQVKWDVPARECNDPSTARALLPDRALGAEDVITSPVDEEHQLVWVVTNRFASGDGMGPAAVVEVRPHKLIVRAIGTLRANTGRAKLRLENIAKQEVLVAEGEHCATADPASCERSVRLMPVAMTAFRPAVITNPVGDCVGAAWLNLGREATEPLSSGWLRRYRLDANLSFGTQALRVQEVVVVNDSDPKQPSAPARLFRRAENERNIRLVGTKFVSEDTPLWSRMVSADET